MAAADSLQYPYLAILELNISEHLKLYYKSITWLSKNKRYDLTRSKCKYLYKEQEADMYTFGLKSVVQVVTARYPGNLPTEFNNIIHSCTSITQDMIYSHRGNFWSKKKEEFWDVSQRHIMEHHQMMQKNRS